MDFSTMKGVQRIVPTQAGDMELMAKMIKGGLEMLKDIFDGVHDLALWGWIGIPSDPSDIFTDKTCENYLVARMKPVKGMHNHHSLFVPAIHFTYS